MKKAILFFAFSLLFAMAQAQQFTEEEIIKQVALDYIEGYYAADTLRIQNAISPELKKRGILKPPQETLFRKVEASYSDMIEWTTNKENQLIAHPEYTFQVEVYGIGKNIAMAKTIAPHFIDYLHLGKIDGKWKIFNVIWELNYTGKVQ